MSCPRPSRRSRRPSRPARSASNTRINLMRRSAQMGSERAAHRSCAALVRWSEMTSWDPREYLRFGDERTRPAVDLASRIAVDRPSTVVDLGCGPGNSTRVLRSRWPEALVIGVDSSVEMIDAARDEESDASWVVSSIQDWSPERRFDVFFSNATLQWLPDHGDLIARLFGHVAPGGALAFQIPSADFALVYSLMREIALDGPWAARMVDVLHTFTMETPDF